MPAKGLLIGNGMFLCFTSCRQKKENVGLNFMSFLIISLLFSFI